MDHDNQKPEHDHGYARIEPYDQPAGGWGALLSVARNLKRQETFKKGSISLLNINQPTGFDCPGCAWPEKKDAHAFNFCENGPKAVAFEATSKRVSPEFFATHTVSWLTEQSDFFLEDAGRITDPMRYDVVTDKYVPISWDEAFELIAKHLQALDDPNQAAFYTSGRASNEAAFLYQLFVRSYGTNNFPDCSNMCHETTSVGLKDSIGLGKGTVTLDDFDQADAIFSFGHNPGTNHPRMLATLREVSKRGGTIIAINPLKERGLERFQDPQAPLEMITNGSTPISRYYFQPKVGGDYAIMFGMLKHLLEWDQQAIAKSKESVFDRSFIAVNTVGFEEMRANGLIDGAITPEIARRVSVEYECRVNPVWPMPGILETLTGLREHRITLGIVSNAQFYTPLMFPALLNQTLGELGFAPELCAWSFELGEAKPSTALFHAALKPLRSTCGILPEETLFVGNDMRNDMWAAAQCGVKTVLFAGDRRSLRLREDDPRCAIFQPDAVITALPELLAIC